MPRRTLYLLAMLYGLAVLSLAPDFLASLVGADGEPEAPTPAAAPAASAAGTGVAWFQEMKPFCNTVEVETHVRWKPAPDSFDGTAYEAACFALADRIDRARSLIESLPRERRWQAAGIVFNVGHPAADAGDDVAAGPLMELVVEFWPDHYMALYHAGAARFALGDHAQARRHLERFLEIYTRSDGWTRSARGMLAEM